AELDEQAGEVERQRRQLTGAAATQAQLSHQEADLARRDRDLKAVASELKAREEAMSGNERRLDAEARSLQQQRQELELAGMKAQLAVQQQQQHSPGLSPGLSPLLQATPQIGSTRTASRLQVSSSATPEVGGRGTSADGFGSLIGSRQASPPDPTTGPLSQQTSAGRQPLAPLPSSDRRTTGGSKGLDMSMRRQGDANDTIAAVFNMPGSRRLNPTLSGMSGFSATSNTFSERYTETARDPGQTPQQLFARLKATTQKGANRMQRIEGILKVIAQDSHSPGRVQTAEDSVAKLRAQLIELQQSEAALEGQMNQASNDTAMAELRLRLEAHQRMLARWEAKVARQLEKIVGLQKNVSRTFSTESAPATPFPGMPDANEEYQRPGFPAPATQPNALRRKTGI
ncbi:TPA: hypothetical protein ACH3X3_004662, partial [Trebouxia sp. C0006]